MHFACGHSYNLRSLGENEKECPICAPQFRAILDIKRAMRSGATEQVCVDCTYCMSETNLPDWKLVVRLNQLHS